VAARALMVALTCFRPIWTRYLLAFCVEPPGHRLAIFSSGRKYLFSNFVREKFFSSRRGVVSSRCIFDS